MTLFDFFTAVLGGLCGYWLGKSVTWEHHKRDCLRGSYPPVKLPFPWKLVFLYGLFVALCISAIALAIVASFQ